MDEQQTMTGDATAAPPRRRGRPPIAEDVEVVSVRLDGELLDRLVRLAARRDIPVADAHRMALEAGVAALFVVEKYQQRRGLLG